jgi:biopolymer transport protein ExbD
VLWNGTPMDRATLDSKLPSREGQAGDNQSEFHIRPNKLVEYKYVAAVLASAQRHGVTKIGLVGNEQFMQ